MYSSDYYASDYYASAYYGREAAENGIIQKPGGYDSFYKPSQDDEDLPIIIHAIQVIIAG